MNPTIALLFAGLALVSSNEIIQGPSMRTFNVGPDGHFIDSLATGGAVIDGPIPQVVPPTLQAVTGSTFRSWAPQMPWGYVAPNMPWGRAYEAPFIHPSAGVPHFARSFYEPSFYHDGAFPVPYGKAIVSGPSGTIVADHH